ncbi:MAG: hypothetical protein ABIT47_01160 [Candidatus Paceibacterota bacterium]
MESYMKEVHVYDKSSVGKMALTRAVTAYCDLGHHPMGCGNACLVGDITQGVVSKVLDDLNTFEESLGYLLPVYIAQIAKKLISDLFGHQYAAEIISNAGNAGITSQQLERYTDKYRDARYLLVELPKDKELDLRVELIQRARTILWAASLTFFNSHTIVWREPLT